MHVKRYTPQVMFITCLTYERLMLLACFLWLILLFCICTSCSTLATWISRNNLKRKPTQHFFSICRNSDCISARIIHMGIPITTNHQSSCYLKYWFGILIWYLNTVVYIWDLYFGKKTSMSQVFLFNNLPLINLGSSNASPDSGMFHGSWTNCPHWVLYSAYNGALSTSVGVVPEE